MRKGAVPVIATVLLLAIISAMVLVVYSYVNGATVLPDTGQHTGKMLEKLKPVEVQGWADGRFNLYFMNTGSVDIVVDMCYVKDFNGNTLIAIPFNTSVAVGETAVLPFDPYYYGTSPWDWYEITAVTDRGNKYTANLYGFFSGGYELGKGPEENERDKFYNVLKVNGTSTYSSNLSTLNTIDGKYFNFDSTYLISKYTSKCTDSYSFDISSGNWKKKDPIPALLMADKDTINYEGKLANGTTYVLANFSGQTLNLKYSKVGMNFTFFTQSSLNFNITVQFFDWNRNAYAIAGQNGYRIFNQGNLIPADDVGNNYYNVTAKFDANGLIGQHGEWSVLLYIMTNETPQPNYKFDYFSVSELADYINSFETLFWYQIDPPSENNVTNMLFTTTGIFPSNSSRYRFSIFDFDYPCFYYLGEVAGSSSVQTVIYEVNQFCSRYIDNSTKQVCLRIMPVDDLPSLAEIKIDQARLIVRQVV